MKYLTVSETAKKWSISERSVRNYCAEGKIDGAIIFGKTWKIPDNATKPERKNKKATSERTLLNVLTAEKLSKTSGGIYHKIQVDLTYSSNHIEGSRLTHEQTRYIFETNTIGLSDTAVKVDDVVEAANHFRCIDIIIDNVKKPLSETLIKQLHLTLKNGTTDARNEWFAVGDYKKHPNIVGGKETSAPEQVSTDIKTLLDEYNAKKVKTLDDLIDFHYRFESIHPFQDGNGRIGRLILFKECLKNNVIPFIIDEELKFYYYRGLALWNEEKGYLIETCLTAQDKFKACLDKFEIKY